MSIVGTDALAYDFEKDGFYYNLDSYDMTAKVTYGEKLYEGNIIIPDEVSYNGRTMSVKTIDNSAFKDCVDLYSIQFSNSVTYINEYAFQNCTKIKRLTIPSNIKYIYKGAFWGCSSLEELIIEDGESTLRCGVNGSESPSTVFDCKLKYLYIGRDIGYPEWGYTYNLDNTNLSTIVIGKGKTFISGFNGAKISTITIPSNVAFIAKGAFKECSNLKSVFFEDSNEELVWEGAYNTTIDNAIASVAPFYDCPIKEAYIGRNVIPTNNNIYLNSSDGPFDRTSVKEIVISNNVTTLCGINYCDNMKEIVIPSSVQKVYGFKGCNSLVSIKCMATTPPIVGSSAFTNNTYLNTILYVPIGSIDNYKNDDYWGKFFNIQEIANDEPNDKQKCDKPTISYNEGKLSFHSETEDAIYHSTITNPDISSYIADEVQLEVIYTISVYATKTGYEDSEIATATLCWIDVAPKTEGVNNVAQVKANAVMIKADGGQLTIEGVDDNTSIAVYSINGVQVGTATSRNGVALVNTNIPYGSAAIVKIGNKSIKIVMK